jgi:hypothetical protein
MALFRYASRLQNLQYGDNRSQKAWAAMYPNIPFQIFEVFEDVYRGRNPFFARIVSLPPRTTEPHSSKFTLNLADAVIRQWDFFKRITDLYPQDPVGIQTLNVLITRYTKFMNLMKGPQG